MYDPTVGRFITLDPIGFEGPDANTYRYVGNSPTNATDPTGLAPPTNPAAEAAKEKEEIIKKAREWWKKEAENNRWPDKNCEEQALACLAHIGNNWKYWNIQGCTGWRFRLIWPPADWPNYREAENALYIAPTNGNPLKPFVLDVFHDYDNKTDAKYLVP
jgi:uncharacterized protein RhaS with RHS repeats